jgi:ligand-binding SRPBCC domain-containing protein
VITSLKFETTVAVGVKDVWDWITSWNAISKEMAPYLKMTVSAKAADVSLINYPLGKPMFESWIKLFGVIPIDYSQLTIISLEPGVGFIEQSPMASMNLWRHERRIQPAGNGCKIIDTLTFEPRFLKNVLVKVVKAFFTHRHRMLNKYLGKLDSL